MNGIAVLQAALESTRWLLGMYLSDLEDADLLVRPTAGANHTAWQLGHLINSERFLVQAELPEASYPELPENFADRYTNETASSNEPGDFLTKDEYVELLQSIRTATIAAVGKLSEADLDRPAVGPVASICPTLGAVLLLVSNHTLMHGGQITVVRRMLNKPVLF